MIFAVICAGGIGSRMGGDAKKPKQYLNIGEKPIILHTIDKFLVSNKFEQILVLCPEDWMSYTENLINEYLNREDRIRVLKGGKSRNDTIMNAIDYIEMNYGLKDETIIVTHDAVRPFLTQRILEENIEAVFKYGACSTVIPVVDTIIESKDSKQISHIPERKKLYRAQTPQSFRAKKLKELYRSLSDEEKERLTDAAKIYILKHEPVYMVQGEVFNIKITYSYDLKVADARCRMLDKERLER